MRAPRRRLPVVRAAAVGLAASAALVAVGFGAPAAAGAGCGEYGALAAADGIRTLASAPGSSPTDVDGQGPAAQAQADSTAGSTGYAGIPFSNAAAGNAGAANLDATQVPVFAISQFPSRPKASTSTPAGGVESTSEERSSAAKASAGGPASGSATAGNTTAAASASCADDGTIKAEARNSAQVIDVGGVLRIASVTSHAVASVSASGQPTLQGTIDVEGVTVLGQVVGIGDRGLVVGASPAAVPAGDNPLVQALDDAGIAVRTLGVTKDEATGDVLAPSLEITVSRSVPGVGTGPNSVTYTFGRAHARASGVPSEDVTDVAGGAEPVAPLGAVAAPVAAGDLPIAAAPTATGRPTSGPAASPARAVPVQRIVNASAASLYPPLAVGAVVFAAAWLLFRTLGVRLRWN
jgi:hypothetical protein